MDPVIAERSGAEVAVDVPADEAAAACRQVLASVGVPADLAGLVADDLVDAERAGYPSHGLLRLGQWVTAVRTGVVDPLARPVIRRQPSGASVVDGRRAFGVTCAAAVATELAKLLEQVPVAAVSLINGHHLGRLSKVARPLAAAGHVVLGFANFRGSHQVVAPYGGAAGRLSTNPVLFAFPTGDGDPIVVDLSTSAVAEGRVRAAARTGRTVPPSWLVDADGAPTGDPAGLYTDPPTAALAPMAGHKGFALAVAVEILAGILTGAGHAGPDPLPPTGNGGLFLALHPTLFGRTADAVHSEIAALEGYLRDCPSTGDPVRLPGRDRPHDDVLTVAEPIWREVLDLRAQTATTPTSGRPG